jgi:hypothetical protein
MTIAILSPGRDMYPEHTHTHTHTPQRDSLLSATGPRHVSKVGPSWHDQAAMAGTVTYELTEVRNASKRIVYNYTVHQALTPALYSEVLTQLCRWAHIYGFSALFQCCVRCPKLQNFWIRIFYVVLSWRALHYNKPKHNCVCAHAETGNSFEPQTPWFSQLDSGCGDTITKFKLCATSDSFHVNTASKHRISPTTYSQFVKHVTYKHVPQSIVSRQQHTAKLVLITNLMHNFFIL